MKLYVVTGMPCSGKTTYVKENMKSGDIVFDTDEIVRAFTYSKNHTVNKEGVVPFILKLRYIWLRELKTMPVKGDAWLIASNITDSLKKNFRIYEHEIIEMDTDKETCIERLYKDKSRPDKKEWEKIILEY